ncbi:MAG: hypothetical protein NVS1B4_07010 [Gemmatimonadaceae bacterium]
MEEHIVNAALLFLFGVTLVLSVTSVIRQILARRPTPTALGSALEERLLRIEQVVEATALEVERIGEGQRFTTKLLVDGPRSASGGERVA